MKHLLMTRRKDPALPARRPDRAGEGRAGGAFDLWLQRGLHQLFDGVASEPIPDELLRLIEDDRRTVQTTATPAVPPDRTEGQ